MQIPGGNVVTDTIELLETIGGDASLRHAASDALVDMLESAQASAELVEAAAMGSGEPLRRELGIHRVENVLHTHAPGHDDDDEGECDPPKPERRQPGEPPPGSPDRENG